jgi:hypothetical protein
MAEDNTTDQIGGIDNISPFLSSGQIGIQEYQPIPAPERFDINSLPGGKFTSNPTYPVKDGLSGSTPSYPVKNAAQAATIGMDKGVALARQLEASLNGMEDKNNYAKIYAYDAGKNGAFKARYKAYGQETFDKVGFHPLIDNETWFNKNTTGWDDFKRMMTHSAWPLFSQGFMDPIKSYASFFGNGGDIMGDTTGAASYDELSAIGYSTKGGIGGFTTNLFQSAAYSVGILAEGALEGALVGAAVGAAEGGLPAIPGAAIGGIGGFLKSLWRLPSSLAKMSASLGKMAFNLNKAAKLSQAKNLFVNAGKSMGNFFNPIENTVNAGMNYVFRNPDDLTALARSAKTAGALWHDVKNLNMALSEGRLEGGMAENRVYEKLYNDHYNLYGEPPDDATQQDMHEQAKEANFTNTIANSLLVFYSNKLVFPSLTQAKFLKGMPKAGFGTVVGQVGNEYQLVYTAGKEAAEGVYTAEKISLANAVRGFVQPKIYGRVALNYFKKNLVEGLQEVSQDAIASATEDYYTKTYYDPTAKNFQFAMGTLKAGIGKQISSQGLETFLSGFAMGSILQLPSTIGKYMSVGYNKYYKNRENYQEYIDGMESSANATVDALNTMQKNGKYFFDPRLGNYVNQVLIGKQIGEDDTRTKEEIKDDEFAAFQSAVMTSLRTGTFDLFLNNFAEYKQASPKDIEEAWNLEEGQGEKALESMDKAITNAKIIANRYGEAKKKMKYLKNLSNFEEGTEEYKMGQLYNEAYEAGIYNLVFTQSAFDDNLGRLNNLYQDIGNLKALQEAGFTDVANLVEPGKLNREIQMLQTEIEAAETYTDPDAIAQVQRKKALMSAMTNFQKTQDTLIYEYLNNEKIKERKAELIAEDPSLDPNSLELKVIDELIEEYEANQTNPFLEYKSAFTELLKAYAGSPEKAIELEHEIMNKGGIDKMFDALVDTHIIRKANTKLIQYINLLNDPQGFYEHIERNFEWMKKLYNKKEQYYKDIVNSELTNIQRNEILNTLAAQGIYVDLDQFAAWVEDHNNVPEYFIDAPKSMIINQDSILYQEYVQIFNEAANLEDMLPKSKMTDKEIADSRINEVEDERVEKLDQAKQRYNVALKKELGYDEKEYMAKLAEYENQQAELNLQKQELDTRKKILEKSLKQLDSNNHVEVLAVYPTMSDLGYINDALYAAAEEAVLNNPESLAQARAAVAKYDETESQEERSTAAFYSVILKPLVNDALAEVTKQLETIIPEPVDPQTTKQYAVYQEELKAINDKYDGLVQNLKNDLKKQGIDPDAVTEITIDTDYAQMPQDLKDILDPLFLEHLSFIEVSPTLADVNPGQYNTIRKNWIETQGAIIRKYNADKKAEAAERAKKLAEPPVLQWSPKGEKVLKVTAQTSGAGLTAYYDKLSKILEAGEYVNKKKETVQLTPEDIENIKADLAGLEGYLDARAKTYKPQSIAEEVVDRIIKNVINAQDQVVDVFDESGRKIGRRFADVAEDQPLPVRATKVAEQVDLEITGKDPFLYNRLEDETIQKDFRRVMASEEVKNEDKVNVFMTAFEKKNYPAFRTKRKLDLLRAALETELTEDNLVKTVQRLAYDESTIAGDNVDNLIRDFLTPDAITGFKQITWDPNVMTEEAFNALFHPAYGIVSKLRQGVIDGQYQILSENVKVFDKRLKEAGITGELDLLAIDSDGNVSIIDIKTGKFKNWEAFGTGAKSDKQTYFRAQQSIYKNLFYNMTGIDVQRISLLPIGITTDLDGKILELGLTELTPEGEDTLELEYLPEVEAAGVTKIAPVEAAPTPTTAAPAEDIQVKKADIKRRREEELKENNFRIRDKIEVWEYTNDEGEREQIQIIYYADGTKEGRALDENGKNLGTIFKGIQQEVPMDKLLPFEDFTLISTEANPATAIADRINAKYDAELAALEGGVTESKKTIPLSDPSKVSLEENLNKPVMYNGRLGKLILLDDGVFGVELDQSSKVTELSLVLEGLKASLEVELGEFGNPTQAAELKNTIAEVQTELDKQAQTKQVIELTRDLMPVKDGKLLLSQAGVFPINNITEVAQVTVINKEQYDAKFDDPSEKTATINGVKYTVNRNTQGNIVSLSYGVNDKAIADIEAETKELSERINKLKDKRSEIFLRPTAEERTTLTNEINKEQSKINQLNKKRLDLLKSNSKRTVSGGNANNLIFALNKLPNSFQKGHEEKTATNEKKELKQIASLSLASDEANRAMDEILGLNYPDALDTLIEEGISKVNNSDLNTINKWAEDAIANLEELASMMYNKNEIVTEVFNQINALSSLLSDISKINLTKNGKISKRQKPEVKEIFGPERKQVPNRPSVSEVSVPVGGQAEAISRPATGEELSQLREKVKKAKQKGDELIGEILLAESKPVSPIVEEINSTKDQAKLQEVYDKAIIQEAKKPGTVDLNAVKEAFDTRQRELATVMDIGNITVNEPVISKKDIDEALAGSTFLVSSFKGNKVYVTNLKTGKGQWYNNSELVDNFKKAPVEGIEMEEEIELTPDDVEDFKVNTETVNKTLEDTDALNAAAKSVEEAQTKGSFREQLKNKICNI